MLHRAVAASCAAVAIWAVWGFSAAQRSSPQIPAPPTATAGQPSAPVPGPDSVRRSAGRRAQRSSRKVDAKAAPPRRIQIPSIGVSAPVIPLGLNPDHTIQTPRAWGDTGWYKPGPKPGERGPAVVVGHVDSTTGPAVFYRLRDLRVGDLIRIRRSDGSAVRFTVRRVEHWPKSDFPTRRVYGPASGSVLRLVTCSGNFDRSTGHYVDNTIVYASRA